jgi:hypothetical protein
VLLFPRVNRAPGMLAEAFLLFPNILFPPAAFLSRQTERKDMHDIHEIAA